MILEGLVIFIGGLIVLRMVYLSKCIDVLIGDMDKMSKRTEDSIDHLRNRLTKSNDKIADLELGVHYIVFKKDYEWGASYISDFGSDGNPYFNDCKSGAMKFNLKRALELKKQWGFLIKNTMTGEIID